MKEMVLLKVNNEVLTLQRLLSFMRLTGLMNQIEDSFVKCLLIKEEVESAGVKVTDEELQEHVNELRYGLGLDKAEDTYRWLEKNNMTVEDLETQCECAIRTKKFTDYISQGKVEEYFAKNMLDFEKAEISQIIVQELSVAQELVMQVKDGDAPFEDLARTYSKDYSSGWGGFVGTVSRTRLKPEFESAIFSSKEGDIIGPFESDRGFHIIKVHSVQPAKLDEETRETVKEKILNQWLEEKKKKASIEFLL
ncbi:MAG: peptidylprolyl isomerase [Bacillota bacterium]